MAVTPVSYTGTGKVTTSDERYIKYVGKTRSEVGITIEIPKAICRSNPDWAFAEKGEVVPEIEFEGLYEDEKLMNGDVTEPWTITLADGSVAGNGSIVLGVGKFYVGTSSSDAVCVGLTRGGGQFTVERAYRDINADNDPGAVSGRIAQDEGRPKMKFNALQWIGQINKLYAGIKTVTT